MTVPQLAENEVLAMGVAAVATGAKAGGVLMVTAAEPCVPQQPAADRALK